MGKRRHLADEVKIKAMWSRCPHCQSPPGTYCETRWGEPAYTPHKDRMDLGRKLVQQQQQREKQA